jgi:hypothetical protein
MIPSLPSQPPRPTYGEFTYTIMTLAPYRYFFSGIRSSVSTRISGRHTVMIERVDWDLIVSERSSYRNLTYLGSSSCFQIRQALVIQLYTSETERRGKLPLQIEPCQLSQDDLPVSFWSLVEIAYYSPKSRSLSKASLISSGVCRR